MSIKIQIKAEDIWTFFQNNKLKLSEEMVLIAENTSTEYAIYITEDRNLPLLLACKGNNDAEGAVVIPDKTSSKDLAQKIYEKYLFPVNLIDAKATKKVDEEQAVSILEDTETLIQSIDDKINEREEELALALYDFLNIVVHEDISIEDYVDLASVNDILEHLLSYISEQHCIPVYRPTFYSNENEEDFYCEYPYEKDMVYISDDEWANINK